MLKKGRCLQQILRLQIHLYALRLSYHPCPLPFWKSRGALSGPGDMGQPAPFQVLQGNDPVSNLFPGQVLNSRFRQAVRSSTISVGVSRCFVGSLDRFFMWDQETCSLVHVRHISKCIYNTEPTSALKPAEMDSSSPWRPNYLPSTGPPLLGSRQLPPFSRHGSWKHHLLWTALTLLSHLVLGCTACPGPSMRDRDTLSQDNTPTVLFHSRLFLRWESMPCSEHLSSLLAWLDIALPLHHSIVVSNVWVVAVWIHTTGTSLWDFLIGSDLMNHHFWGQRQDCWNYYLNLPLPYLSFRVSPSRCFVSHPLISACHLLWCNREDTSIFSSVTINDFFSIIGDFGSMQVHSQRQYFLIDESFLNSVMHFFDRFDSSFCRDSSAGHEVIRFPLSLPVLPYVRVFFFPFFIICSTMYILDWDCCACVLCWSLFVLLPGLLFLSGLN